jgi:hypothetical protein
MKLLTTPIPDGSLGVRVWLDLPEGDTDTGEPYQFACNLCRYSDEMCEVTQAIGELSNEVAIMIGLKAIEMGYSYLTFHRSMDGLATRWATLTRRKDGMDYYTVDLMQALEVYEGRA